MIRTVVVAVLFITAVAIADDKLGRKSPIEKLESLQKDLKAAEEAFNKAHADWKDGKGDEKTSSEFLAAFSQRLDTNLKAAFEIAKADPKSAVGFAALEWVLSENKSYYLPFGKEAIELATAHYSLDPNVGKMAACVGGMAHAAAGRRARTGPAVHSCRGRKEPRTKRPEPKAQLSMGARSPHRTYKTADRKRSPNADDLAEKALAAYERVLKEYGDCPHLDRENTARSLTVGDAAESALFELRRLRVGKVAPEIEGSDLDGKNLKLSDTRGKVVVIIFWVEGCCWDCIPHERKLAERLKGRPFQMIGVNGDGNLAKAKKEVAREGLPWRSFQNGENGGIAKTWNVIQWPMIYVLDHKGVIRFKNSRGDETDNAVNGLLRKLRRRINETTVPSPASPIQDANSL